MKLGFSRGAFLFAALLVFAASVDGDKARAGDRDPTLGTTSAPGLAPADVSPAAAVALGTLTAVRIVARAQAATGGVGLRNLAGGAITIAGVVPPVKAAYIYWAVISDGPVPRADYSVRLQRLSPTFSVNETVSGRLIGAGPSPCWGGSQIAIFRGVVSTSVANGNGTYLVRLNAGATGSTAGEDPWVDSPFPLVDGASLVLVGTGTGTVALYDHQMSGKTFYGSPGLTYTLRSPVNFSQSAKVILHNIGADGQGGDALAAIAGTSAEYTTVASVKIAGRGSDANDSDWNGNAAGPLPRLWDDTGHDITAVAHRIAGGLFLKVAVNAVGGSSFDCLTPVANVLSVAAPPVAITASPH